MTDAGKLLESGISYLDVVIIFSVGVYVLNTYLDFRQVSRLLIISVIFDVFGISVLASILRSTIRPPRFAAAAKSNLKDISPCATEGLLLAS